MYNCEIAAEAWKMMQEEACDIDSAVNWVFEMYLLTEKDLNIIYNYLKEFEEKA